MGKREPAPRRGASAQSHGPIIELLSMVEACQRHRGWRGAQLAGRPEFDDEIRDQAERIAAELPRCCEILADSLRRPQLAAMVHDLWAQIVAPPASSGGLCDVELSFMRHNLLIACLIAGFASAAEFYPLPRQRTAVQIEAYALARVNCFSRLPRLLENLAQLRGRGVTAAAGRVNVRQRAEILRLLGEVETLLQISRLPAKGGLAGKIEGLATRIRVDLLSGDGSQIDTRVYFSEASSALAWVANAIVDALNLLHGRREFPNGRLRHKNSDRSRGDK